MLSVFLSGALAADLNQAESQAEYAAMKRKAAEVLRGKVQTYPPGSPEAANLLREAERFEREAAEAERRQESMKSLPGQAAPSGSTAGAPATAGTPGAGPRTPSGISGKTGDTSSGKDGEAAAGGGGAGAKPDFRTADSAALKAYSDGLPAATRERSRLYSAQIQDLLNQNEVGAARRRAMEALDLDPANAQAHVGFADILNAEGNAEEARRHYATAAATGADTPAGAIAADRLARDGRDGGAASGAAEAILGQFGARSGVTTRAGRQWQSCERVVVGEWSVQLNSGWGYNVSINADGTANAHCTFCMESQRWRCEGDMFVVLDPYRVEQTISDDGNRLDSAYGFATRVGAASR